MIRDRVLPMVLAGWALAAIVLCLALAGNIAGLHFPDPDDSMRLLEARDWLSGQSWWDVGQHRLNGGMFPMHWSRLVDVPLAVVMLVADRFVSVGAANRIAMTVVPLMTLLALMALAAKITIRLAGRECAQLAVLLVPLSIPIVYQVRPMRIDHHGWQIVLALAAVLMLLGRPTGKAGAACGAALGILLTISLEGLPIAVVIAGVAAVAWAIDPARRAFLLALGWTFFASALALHVATRGPGMFAPACDAVSPAWLAVLGVAAIGLTAATLAGRFALPARLAALAAAGAACAATLVLIAPRCTQGPFATLDPLVYTLWYQKVSEGLPIWRQEPSWAIMTIAFPIVGLIGTCLALRRSTGLDSARWALLLAVLVGGIAVAVMVIRAGATANALALPGGAWVLLGLFERARRIGPVLLRAAATAGAIVAVSPGLVAGAVFAAGQSKGAPTFQLSGGSIRAPCADFSAVRVMARLPRARVFAPIDLTPELIATTDDTAIAGGYHRNSAAMHRVIAAFTGTPEAAHAAILASGARYVIGCPSLEEAEIYKSAAPDGLWARLERGDRFAWLTPVPMAGSPLLVWQLQEPARTPLSSPPARH